ncbi:hypothetical protein ColTof3_06530 [Colletotrichum tofieldiae]|nr:hypothetical protein ColTof3_06530 [Colletotrichum tofieldiae]
MEPVTPVVGEAKVPEVGQELTKSATALSALVAGVDRAGQKADKPILFDLIRLPDSGPTPIPSVPPLGLTDSPPNNTVSSAAVPVCNVVCEEGGIFLESRKMRLYKYTSRLQVQPPMPLRIVR